MLERNDGLSKQSRQQSLLQLTRTTDLEHTKKGPIVLLLPTLMEQSPSKLNACSAEHNTQHRVTYCLVPVGGICTAVAGSESLGYVITSWCHQDHCGQDEGGDALQLQSDVSPGPVQI